TSAGSRSPTASHALPIDQPVSPSQVVTYDHSPLSPSKLAVSPNDADPTSSAAMLGASKIAAPALSDVTITVGASGAGVRMTACSAMIKPAPEPVSTSSHAPEGSVRSSVTTVLEARVPIDSPVPSGA